MTVGIAGFRFHEGVAPFGRLDLLTPHTNGEPHDSMPVGMRYGLYDLGSIAWLHSSWLRQVIGADGISQSAHGERPLFSQGLERDFFSSYYKEDHALTVAAQPTVLDADSFDTTQVSELKMYNFSGYGTGMLDVSGNAFQRFWKSNFTPDNTPDKVYGKTTNINVFPHRQGQKIGAALLFGVLAQLPDEKKATVYVARKNGGLIERLEEIGYRETGSQPRDDLVQGYTIEEVRLEAPSVGEAKENLEKVYGWLKEREAIQA